MVIKIITKSHTIFSASLLRSRFPSFHGVERNWSTREPALRARQTHCHRQTESNRHTVVACPRYTEARQAFEAQTGIRLCNANYIDVMAINYRKLGVDSKILATALCRFLAQIARLHTKTNKRASVAHPLGRNQRRLIIQAHRLERPPD